MTKVRRDGIVDYIGRRRPKAGRQPNHRRYTTQKKQHKYIQQHFLFCCSSSRRSRAVWGLPEPAGGTPLDLNYELNKINCRFVEYKAGQGADDRECGQVRTPFFRPRPWRERGPQRGPMPLRLPPPTGGGDGRGKGKKKAPALHHGLRPALRLAVESGTPLHHPW